MKYNFILHARRKLALAKGLNNKTVYIPYGLMFKPLPVEERENFSVGSRGGVTIVICKNTDGTLIWNASKCNITDQYNKKTGIRTAWEKSKQDGIVTDDLPFEDVIKIAKKVATKIDKHGYNVLPSIMNTFHMVTVKKIKK